MYKIKKYKYKLSQTGDLHKKNIYNKKLLNYMKNLYGGNGNVSIIPDTLLTLDTLGKFINGEKVDIGYKSDHALITFTKDDIKYYSWNLLNEDEVGSIIKTFTSASPNIKHDQIKNILTKFSKGRMDKIIEKINELPLDAIICLQEVGEKMILKIKEIKNRVIIQTTSPDYLGNVDKKEYRVILLPEKPDKVIEIKQFVKDMKYRNNLLIKYNGKWICNTHIHHSSTKKEVIDFIYNVIKKTEENSPVLFIGDTNNCISEPIIAYLGIELGLPQSATFIKPMKNNDSNESDKLDGYFIVKPFEPIELEKNHGLDFLKK